MKHLLNNISEEEKNSILEQHKGGMKIFNENFNKMVNKKLGQVDLYEQTEKTSNTSTENTRKLSDISPDIFTNTNDLRREAMAIYSDEVKFGVSALNLFRLLSKKLYKANENKEGNSIKDLYMKGGGNQFKVLVPDNTVIESSEAYIENFGTPTLTYIQLKQAMKNKTDEQMAKLYNSWLDTKLKA